MVGAPLLQYVVSDAIGCPVLSNVRDMPPAEDVARVAVHVRGPAVSILHTAPQTFRLGHNEVLGITAPCPSVRHGLPAATSCATQW